MEHGGMTKLTKLIFCVALPLLAGSIGSYFTSPSIPTWYASLVKPVFNPPSWVFGPVWTTLFIMMGVALYLVLQKNAKNKKEAYAFFGIQLFLNVLWSFLFFGLHSPLLAFIEIIFLLAAILATMYFFNRISKTASYLLIPYALWVSFATVLNFSLYLLN